MKKIYFPLILIFISFSSFSQGQKRYKNIVFESIDTLLNIPYGQSVNVKNENESSQKFTIINEIWDNEILVASLTTSLRSFRCSMSYIATFMRIRHRIRRRAPSLFRKNLSFDTVKSVINRA